MSSRSPPLPLPQELLVSKPPIVSPRTVDDDDSGVDTQWLKKELWMLLQTTTLLASSSARRPDLEVVRQYLPMFTVLKLLALMLAFVCTTGARQPQAAKVPGLCPRVPFRVLPRAERRASPGASR